MDDYVLTTSDGRLPLSRIVPLNSVKLFEVQKLAGKGIYRYMNRENCCRVGVVTEGSFKIDGVFSLTAGEGFFSFSIFIWTALLAM